MLTIMDIKYIGRLCGLMEHNVDMRMLNCQLDQNWQYTGLQFLTDIRHGWLRLNNEHIYVAIQSQTYLQFIQQSQFLIAIKIYPLSYKNGYYIHILQGYRLSNIHPRYKYLVLQRHARIINYENPCTSLTTTELQNTAGPSLFTKVLIKMGSPEILHPRRTIQKLKHLIFLAQA